VPLSSEHETKLSKLLAFLLRHRPDSVGLTLDPEGWVEVAALVEGINEQERLPFALNAQDLLTLVGGVSAELFEITSADASAERVRARAGHSVEGVALAAQSVPEFLFFRLEPDAFDVYRGAQSLSAPEGAPFRLVEDEALVGEEHLVVVEAGRAVRNGASFEAQDEPGVFLCQRVPLRYVFSHRAGYVRQISAGGVLVRGTGGAVEFALIRTLPRSQTQGPADGTGSWKAASSEAASSEASSSEASSTETGSPATGSPATGSPATGSPATGSPETGSSDVVSPLAESPDAGEVAEGRGVEDDRRRVDRRLNDRGAPSGSERRRGRSRRLRLRRRGSGRWDPSGRLELPKGKLEPGETAAEAAVREAHEELGVKSELRVRAALSKNHYTFRTPDGQAVFKTVHYFLIECEENEPSFSPRREEGIVSVEWWTGERAIEQVAFPSLKPILSRAWELSQLP
jgi:RNA:NAD 2'-phosphotransferase (TPT1/KptA family)/8-oxo-dGTP pyrophosphatase MutT (NUDIX family)